MKIDVKKQNDKDDIDTDGDDADEEEGDDDLYCVKGRSSRLPARLLLLGKGKGLDKKKKLKKKHHSCAEIRD